MARYRCPACGSPYNGKRCQECCYEPFTEEVAHGNHYHEGEPLVIDEIPSRKPLRPTETKNCNTFPGKRKKKLPTWLRIILILLLLTYGVDILFSIAGSLMINDTVSGIVGGYAEPEPEPIAPSSGTILYNENGILVIAEWQDGDTCTGSIPVYVRNDSDQDIAVTVDLLSVNGYMMNYSFLYCQADAGEEAKDTLWIDDADLQETGIENIATITFCLDIYDTETYEDVAVSDPITLHTDMEENSVQASYEGGTVLYEENGIKFVYTGYSGDMSTNGVLQFYMENNTDRCLQIYFGDVSVNGEPVELYMWRELSPGTRAVAYIDLYPLEEIGIQSIEDVNTLEFLLEASDRDDWDFWFQSEPLSLSLEGA